jgi:WD40 repeat protein
MSRTESSTSITAASKRVPFLLGGTVLICLVAAFGGLILSLQRSLESNATAEPLRREATRLALDRGITLCRSGQVPSGLLWLGRSLEIAPTEDSNLQRVIRTNITSWADRTSSAVDILMHGASVQADACSLDGKQLATAGTDGRVCLWRMPVDFRTPGAQISNFSVGDPPTAYGFSPDAPLLATGSDDGTVRFFNFLTGKQQKPVINQAGSVSSIAISNDGSFLVTGSEAGVVRRWDMKTGKLLGEATGHTDWVLSIAISPDGKFILSGGNDGKAQLWQADPLKPAGPAIDLSSAVTGTAFSPDGSRFMTVAGFNATLFETETMQPDGDPIRHESALRTASFDPTGASIITGCRDGYIRIWDAKTHLASGPSIRCVTAVHLVNFSPDGNTIISADDALGVRIWQKPAGDHPILSINAGLPVTALSFTPDGKQIVVGTSAAGDPGLASDNGSARIYRVEDGQPVSAPFVTKVGVISSAISEDGKLLLTGASNNYVRLRSLPDLTPIGDPLYYGNRLRCVAFAADQKTILASGADAGSQGDIKIWKYDTQPSASQRPEIIDQDQPVGMVSLSPDHKRLVSACGTGSASIWTIADAQPAGLSFAHFNAATVALFQPDGNAVLSGDQNGTARMWDSHTAAAVAPAMQNAGPVSCAAFTPDGNIAAIGTLTPTMKWYGGWGTGTSTVQLWDTRTGLAIGDTLRFPTWAVWRVAISPDGTRLAVGSADGFVRLYRIPIPEHGPVPSILARLQLMLNREMDGNQTELALYAADWLKRRNAAIRPTR